MNLIYIDLGFEHCFAVDWVGRGWIGSALDRFSVATMGPRFLNEFQQQGIEEYHTPLLLIIH
ncbi:hypothetical protein SLEP1_g50009 [Rubroshorea leprosula]|uniref:Uncharacterized protein n=1 Tax=Rubroshorea leprosula TaxID=152421 RepID=A0AAV5M148_9ROSI|nr:hypothetical protein SLEP1_g50009 [Rubroshorea leprosula]